MKILAHAFTFAQHDVPLLHAGNVANNISIHQCVTWKKIQSSYLGRTA